MKTPHQLLTSHVYSGKKYSTSPYRWFEIPLVACHIDRKITGSEASFFPGNQQSHSWHVGF